MCKRKGRKIFPRFPDFRPAAQMIGQRGAERRALLRADGHDKAGLLRKLPGKNRAPSFKKAQERVDLGIIRRHAQFRALVP